MANLVDNRNVHTPEGFQPNVDSRPKAATATPSSKALFWIFGLLIFSWIYYLYKRNKFNRMQLDANNAAATIDTVLVQRFDTLSKLVDQVKSYKEFEKSVLTDVTRMRSLVGQGGLQNGNEIDALNKSVFGRLIAVSESYPELQASSLYKELMNQTTYLERELQAARRLYNSQVNEFNKAIFSLPGSIVAAMKELETLPLFVASEQQKQDVSMSNL
ncbi:LemA protein [Mycoplasmopsis mustelae]|uniref:LemA protein n=1 Tax=Mycoplasmopsis mustelae TaxID=171289 RepID=A0A4R7UFI8_9BACT|nr:LemA family protein [Mycoplasmopsis mustelae]TDV24464.1 LemA protein [Mycoplasmopsis mustelae]